MDGNNNNGGVNAMMLSIVAQIGELKGLIASSSGLTAALEERHSGRIAALEHRVIELEQDKESKTADVKHWQIIVGTLLGGISVAVMQWFLPSLRK